MKHQSLDDRNSGVARLSVAVAPNLFDVVQDSDHIASLCIANLLSQGLWEFRQKIQDRLALEPESETEDLPQSIRAIQKFINKSFTHLHPNEVASIYGMLDLEEEKKRFKPRDFAGMVAGLKAHFQSLALTDGHLSTVSNEAVGWLERGQFPNYYYSNFDAIRAQRAIAGQSKKSPYGLTSCLDEVALFIALSLVIPKPQELRAAMVMGSVSHFAAFGYSENGIQWWFNGKNQLYAKSDWDRRVLDFGGDRQACFDHLFSNFSRITTVSGNADLHTGSTDIPRHFLNEYLQEMEIFFGLKLRQLQKLYVPISDHKGEADHANFLRDLIGLESRDDLLKRMQGRTELWIQSARYCSRTLEVDDFSPYLESARRNPLASEVAMNATSLEELITCVRAIKSVTSLFNTIDQIAMPDETLTLKAGSHRDKGLLLHVLIEHFVHRRDINQTVETVFGNEVTLVRVKDHWINMHNTEIWTSPLPQLTLFRL